MSKLAIIGSRGFTDLKTAEAAFRRYFCTFIGEEGGGNWFPVDVDEIISGGARGADTIAEQIATEWGLKMTVFKPDWETHGKKAGFLRNEDIVAAADVVMAFWGVDPKTGELSKGTQHSIGLAKKARKPTIIVYV